MLPCVPREELYAELLLDAARRAGISKVRAGDLRSGQIDG